ARSGSSVRKFLAADPAIVPLTLVTKRIVARSDFTGGSWKLGGILINVRAQRGFGRQRNSFVVLLWSKADIQICPAHVRFRGQSGHGDCTCEMSANDPKQSSRQNALRHF